MIVTAAGWDAVDARALGPQWQSQGEMNLVSDVRRARRTTLERTAKPCGSGTRCWCQVSGGFTGPTGFGKTVNSLATVTRRIRRRGEHDISR
jgi:hypothetical protein